MRVPSWAAGKSGGGGCGAAAAGEPGFVKSSRNHQMGIMREPLDWDAWQPCEYIKPHRTRGSTLYKPPVPVLLMRINSGSEIKLTFTMTHFEEWPVYQQVKSTSCLPRSLNPCSACHCDSCQMFDASLVFLPAAAAELVAPNRLSPRLFTRGLDIQIQPGAGRTGCPGVGWTAGRCG